MQFKSVDLSLRLNIYQSVFTGEIGTLILYMYYLNNIVTPLTFRVVYCSSSRNRLKQDAAKMHYIFQCFSLLNEHMKLRFRYFVTMRTIAFVWYLNCLEKHKSALHTGQKHASPHFIKMVQYIQTQSFVASFYVTCLHLRALNIFWCHRTYVFRLFHLVSND